MMMKQIMGVLAACAVALTAEAKVLAEFDFTLPAEKALRDQSGSGNAVCRCDKIV